jgi:beta-aspartyl-peptidase (threonine type)
MVERAQQDSHPLRPGCNLAAGGARWTVIVHGGFMAARRAQDAAVIAEARTALLAATGAAGRVLDGGGCGLDAVEAALIVMENCPQFDAGRGAALTAAGRVELDAAVMRGADLAAGAVAGVTRVRNPVQAARAVLKHTAHVMLQGRGADDFAVAHGIVEAPEDWFITERMREELRAAQQRQSAAPDMGAVGCVVRDVHGDIAAGTSTGGITNKLPGRVGDSPLIGAGTWADSRWCGVSCTGQGEYFIRVAAAHTVAALMEMRGLDLPGALADVIRGRVAALGGRGGAIAVDHAGNACALANAPGLVFAGSTAAGAAVCAFDGDVANGHDAGSIA